MALNPYYSSGTVSVAAGGTVVTGTGTSWLGALTSDFSYEFVKSGYSIPIQSIDSNTQVTLAEPWPGTILTNATYRIRFLNPGSALAASVRAAIDGLSNLGLPGSGASDLQLILNKATAANIASILLKDAQSGRAECGLVGDDNFHLKLSADGLAWKEALNADRTSGLMTVFADPTAALGIATKQYADSNNTFLTSNRAANTFYAGPASGIAAAPTFRALSVNDPSGWGFTVGSIPFMTATGIAQNNQNLFWDNVNNRLAIGSTTPISQFHVETGAAGAVISLKDNSVAENIGILNIVSQQGLAGLTTGRLGSSSVVRFIINASTGNTGINTSSPLIVLDVNGPIGAKVYTVATLPSATVRSGQLAFVSDATLTAITGLGLAPTGGGANFVPVYSDGAGWKII